MDSNLLLTAGFRAQHTLLSFTLQLPTIKQSYSRPASHRSGNHAWMSSLKKTISSGINSSSSSFSIVSIRRLNRCILGMTLGKTNDIYSSNSEVWLLGLCYRIGEASPPDESTSELQNGQVGFQRDFFSRIWITYRKG